VSIDVFMPSSVVDVSVLVDMVQYVAFLLRLSLRFFINNFVIQCKNDL